MISAADLPLTRLRPGLSATAHRPATPAGGRSDEWSGREDLNLRLHGPEPCALPGCATPRCDRAIIHSRFPGVFAHQLHELALAVGALADLAADVLDDREELVLGAADGQHHAPALGELLHQRRRHARAAGGDDDA